MDSKIADKPKTGHLRLAGVRRVFISGEYIKLDALLKFASVASSGSEAKLLISSGGVFVNSEVCLMRGKKIRNGDIVRYTSETLVVKSK